MNSIFTVNYFETLVGEYLEKNTRGSVFIPASAQEEGIDLILYKFEEGINKMVTIQVKSSRCYETTTKKSKTLPLDKNTSKYPMQSLWFNRYEVKDNAEWFIIGGDFFRHNDEPNKNNKDTVIHDTIFLAFTKQEMIDFLDNCRQVKNPDKKDDKFSFIFDENKNIYHTRGCVQNGKSSYKNVNEFLIENRMQEIINSMH